MKKLAKAKIAVFGIGGVGGHAAEALARCGVGQLDLYDNDIVSESNINRQTVADITTIGQRKVKVMSEKIKNINPDAKVETFNVFYLPENSKDFDLSKYDYVVDAVDTVTAKLELIVKSEEAGVPVISSMGAGNKLNPVQLEVDDIYNTSVCPLAKVMRRELKQRGINKLKVVYSKEKPIKPLIELISESGKPVPGSVSFVPPVAGLIIASEVVKDLTGVKND